MEVDASELRRGRSTEPNMMHAHGKFGHVSSSYQVQFIRVLDPTVSKRIRLGSNALLFRTPLDT